MSILLIAPPWPLFNRPSIQIGALKAWLERGMAGLKIDTRHPYLDLAYRLGYLEYHRISQSSWAAESVFGALLFPEMADRAERLFRTSLKRRSEGGGEPPDFSLVCTRAREATEAFLDSVDLASVAMVGLSACLNQFTAGLYLARHIKELSPDTAIVMGGSSVSGGIGKGVLEAFSFLDFIIDGEGELPLQGLIEFLAGRRTALPEAVVARDGLEKGPKRVESGPKAEPEAEDGRDPDGCTKKLQIKDLDTLPVPDYDGYFREFSQLPSPPALSITLPVEASRGCWWGRCSFCNLNLQWRGYRAKGARRIAKEIDYLSQRYQLLDFALMDNCLPPKGAADIFRHLEETGKDLCLFCELRAVHGQDEYRQFRRGGLRYLQVGIEALSSSLLKRLNKGATVIDNLAALRHAAENGIEIGANLITRFPGSTEEEAAETAANLDFAWPFAPLKAVPFWLGRMSPVFCHPGRFGIKALFPARQYGHIFPKEILDRLQPLILDWRGDRMRQKRIWRSIERRIEHLYRARKEHHASSLLTWREGGDFITIKQRLPDGQVLNHRLAGPSRQIYLAATDTTHEEELLSRFPGISREKLRAFLSDLVKKRLMFREAGRVLALATRAPLARDHV